MGSKTIDNLIGCGFFLIVVLFFMSITIVPLYFSNETQRKSEERLAAKCNEMKGTFYQTFCLTPEGEIIEVDGDEFVIRLPH